ncbi:unnamed protein product, partial [marine sediment metagenome]
MDRLNNFGDFLNEGFWNWANKKPEPNDGKIKFKDLRLKPREYKIAVFVYNKLKKFRDDPNFFDYTIEVNNDNHHEITFETDNPDIYLKVMYGNIENDWRIAISYLKKEGDIEEEEEENDLAKTTTIRAISHITNLLYNLRSKKTEYEKEKDLADFIDFAGIEDIQLDENKEFVEYWDDIELDDLNISVEKFKESRKVDFSDYTKEELQELGFIYT